jgi:hypothetical protein
VPIGYVPGVLLRAATERHADLIAMATHGRGGLARMVLGSVATGTLQRTHLPIMLVHPRPSAAEAVPATVGDLAAGPAGQPPGPGVEIDLTESDLKLIERGLTSLMFQTGQDWLTAGPVRDLLARVKAEEERLTRRTGHVAGRR